MYSGGAEAGTTTIKAMMGEDQYGYSRDNSGVCNIIGGGGDGEGRIGGRGRVG